MFLPDYQTRIVDRLFDTPDLFVPMFDKDKEAALIVPMTRESYSKSVFLDHRTERAAPEAELIPIQSIEQSLRERQIRDRPLRFIIHPAFAGSTLLCRCLDYPGLCLPYKEPYVLTQLCGERRETFVSGRSESTQISLKLVLALLGRSYSASEEIVIKPADACINISRELLGYCPGSMGILLHLPLEEFVVANLKRPDRREYLLNNVPRSRIDLDAKGLLPDMDIDQLSEGEIAAFVWYGLMVYYLEILRDDSLQVRSLDAATFYAKPRDVLEAIVGFLKLSLTPFHIDDAVNRVFEKDSKQPTIAFDASGKAVENAQLRKRLSREIDDARGWIEEHSRACLIPERLPRPLM